MGSWSMARGMALRALCSISSTRGSGSFIMLAQASTSLLMGSPASSTSLKVSPSCRIHTCQLGHGTPLTIVLKDVEVLESA